MKISTDNAAHTFEISGTKNVSSSAKAIDGHGHASAQATVHTGGYPWKDLRCKIEL